MLRNYKITINAPIEICFRSIIGDSKSQEWMSGKMTTEYPVLNEAKMLGLKYVTNYWPFWEITGKIIAYEKPTLYGVDFTSNVIGTKGEFYYHFKPVGPDATEAAFELKVFDDSVAKRVSIGLLTGRLDSAINGHLKDLKRIAESKNSTVG